MDEQKLYDLLLYPAYNYWPKHLATLSASDPFLSCCVKGVVYFFKRNVNRTDK